MSDAQVIMERDLILSFDILLHVCNITKKNYE